MELDYNYSAVFRRHTGCHKYYSRPAQLYIAIIIIFAIVVGLRGFIAKLRTRGRPYTTNQLQNICA